MSRHTPYFLQRQKSKQKGWLLAEGIFLCQFPEISICRNFIIPALFMGGLTVVLFSRGWRKSTPSSTCHCGRGSQGPRQEQGICCMAVGFTSLNCGCRDNGPDMPSAAQSFLLLRFLCRHKENDVAVGQPRRFCFRLSRFNV